MFLSQSTAPLATNAAGKTVLLVEDDPGNAIMLDLLLRMEKRYQVLSFRSGGEVLANLDLIQAHSPALFLLDYVLPRMTGLELYRCLHATEGLGQVPGILVTGSWLFDERHITLAERDLAVMKKPYDIDMMLNTVQNVIARPCG